MTKFFLVVLVLLTACAPARSNARDPLVFQTTAAKLFDATLAAVATTVVKNPLGKDFPFAIKTATKDTGLIVASNSAGYQTSIIILPNSDSSATLSYTLSSENDAYFIPDNFMQEIIKKLSEQFTRLK